MPDVGHLKLLDYQIPVASTGIIFVASIGGTLSPEGHATIEPLQIEWAKHRAASQLAYMGLVRGDTFGFMRETVPMTVGEAADLVGYAPADVISWEDGTEEVPVAAWQRMADHCCAIDHRPGTTLTQLLPDFRPRVIRIQPNIPMPPQPRVFCPCCRQSPCLCPRPC